MLSRSKPRKERRIASAGTSPVAGQVLDQEVAGEGGQETGEIEEGCQHKPGHPSDFHDRIKTFLTILPRVPVNLVPPTRPHLKAIGSTRSQQTQPNVATCTIPYCHSLPRVPVNLVPPTRTYLKAIGSTRSQQTQPTVATCTIPYCQNPKNAINHNNSCTSFNIPDLAKPKPKFNKQGPLITPNSHGNLVTPGSPGKITTPRYLARIGKTVPIIHLSKSRNN